jgi:hypothetical protein
VRIKLYIEGGGDSHLQDTLFRQGWQRFFEKAGLVGRMPATIRGGGRDQTFDLFQTAAKNRRPGELPLLLVDSEEIVPAGRTFWQHLNQRDGWALPEGANADDAYLMICCMETWFLADREMLRHFFGQEWRENAVPEWPHLESVAKARVFQALAQATQACGKKKYSKGRLSFELLGEINPATVETACPAAQSLLQRLRSV